MKPIHPCSSRGTGAGFSLLELLLALSLGLALCGVMLDGLLADGRSSQRLVALQRERAWQRRTLDLIQSDLLQASAVSRNPELESHSCSLSGRTPVLQMSTPAGPITYSVGAAPSSIWRGQVLMRCGPAYGLEGELSVGSTAQNRVVLDGLVDDFSKGLKCIDQREAGWIEVVLVRSLPLLKVELKGQARFSALLLNGID